jgi:hypothetical protein
MKLLFSLPYGIAFRNVVCCGVLDHCLGRGAEATLLLPSLSARDETRISKELPNGVGVRQLMPAVPSFGFTFLKLVKQHLYARRTGLDSFRVRNDRRRREQPLLHLAASAISAVSGSVLSEEWVDRQIARARQPHEEYYTKLLRELKTDAVAVAKPGYQPEDMALIKSARKHRIPVISVDTTSDNIVSKRPTYLAPDALTAWSERMRSEAVEFYRLRAASVTVTGGSPFDVFFSRARLAARADFLTSLGLDPSRKLILFTLNSPVFTPQNPLYIKSLLEAIRRGDIRGNPNVVIRLHPWDLTSKHAELVGDYPGVRLERPFGVPDSSSVYECIPSRDEVLHYGALMTHSDVLVNIASTTALDGIAADTPVISIAYDIEPVPAELSVARLYEFSHCRPVVESGAVRVVGSQEDFYTAVNAYMDDPTIDAAARDNGRRQFLTFSDGASAQRIAQAIVDLC